MDYAIRIRVIFSEVKSSECKDKCYKSILGDRESIFLSFTARINKKIKLI